MNIVAAKRSIPQLRCVCVSPFRYERMIRASGNHATTAGRMELWVWSAVSGAAYD
ncbi:TPA: hypothetical protein PXP38_002071 [Yersinia enterocolitica]|nr:hypothetical protein [Yersinia enterocolitica]